jgi:uncharacterized sulfatase
MGKQPGKLPASIDTAPEVLSAAGYRTLGISENGYAGPGTGLDERFDRFLETHELVSLPRRHSFSLIKYLFQTRRHGPGLSPTKAAHAKQKSYFTMDVAKRELRSYANGRYPVFCYVHFNDTHTPFIPPKSLLQEYTEQINADPLTALDVAIRMHEHPDQLIADGVTQRQIDSIEAMYDATIKYVDRCVGALINFFESKFEETIVVVTSDHGVLLGEYGLLKHRTMLHDGNIHVPLVLSGIPGIKDNLAAPIGHIDVMQTLLSSVGANTDGFHGVDLREEIPDKTISQLQPGSYQDILERNPQFDVSFFPESILTALRTSQFKYLHTNEWSRLYRLPDEKTDIKSEFSDIHSNLDGAFKKFTHGVGEPIDAHPVQVDYSESTKKHLQDMGYL